MKKCPNCQTPIADTGRTCRVCGLFLLNAGANVRLASVGERFGEYVIDVVTYYVIGIGFFIVFVIGFVIALSAGPVGAPATSGNSQGGGGGAVIYVLYFLALHGIYFYFWTKGQTPGKAVLGIFVADSTTGQRVGFGRMALRQIIGGFVAALVFGLGWLWIIWDRDHQGWHDKVASTIVVKRLAEAVSVRSPAA